MSSSRKPQGKSGTDIVNKQSDCFIIMPISDQEGYELGHFTRVYKDIIEPACIIAKFSPRRADDRGDTNIIQVEILKQLIYAPMVICDLSSRNPNVLFELGIRQAFNLPVVLIQDELTPKIFDISVLNTLKYSQHLKYYEVLEDQKKLAIAIKETFEKSTQPNSSNSLISLLGRKPAKIESSSVPEEVITLNEMLFQIQLIRNDLNAMKALNFQPQLESYTVFRLSHLKSLYAEIIGFMSSGFLSPALLSKIEKFNQLTTKFVMDPKNAKHEKVEAESLQASINSKELDLIIGQDDDGTRFGS